MTIYTKLQDQNQKIRNQWFKYSLFYFIGYLIFTIAIFLNYLEPIDQNISQPELWHLVVGTIQDLIFFGITYYFAYKKSGTKWLTWCLLIGPFRLVIEFSNFLKVASSGWEMSILSLDIMLYIGWYILTWKLRKVKRQIQLCKQFPQESKSCIDILERSMSLEDLNSNLYELIQTYPQFEPILSPVYQLRRDELKSINKIESVY